MFTQALLFPIGILLLAIGGDRLVLGSVALSNKLKVPAFITGIFIIGFGTSLPELFVTISALNKNETDIAIGAIIGSNIINILLILGLSLVLSNKKSLETISSKDIFVMIICAFLFSYFLQIGLISNIWSIIMVVLLPIYLFVSYRFFNRENQFIDDSSEKGSVILNLLIGFIAIIYGSEIFIEGLIHISEVLNIPEAIIGISLAAIGTSLPELAVTIASFVRGKGSVAIGNVVGSNIFNILGVLGLSALINGQIIFSKSFSGFDTIILILSSVWVYILLRNGSTNPKLYGSISLIGYFSYMIFLYS
ncbi:MAG: sodium:calcium antiporter [Alphaproteobacteria bacterium]